MKKIPIVILTVLLIGITGVAISLNKSEYENNMTIHILSKDKNQDIKPWYDDGTIYIFLPSYAELDSTEISFDTNKKITVDGLPVSSSIAADKLTPKENHSISIGKKDYNLVLYKSDNVGTMYINTSTGSMDEVYEDINHKEPVSVDVVTQDGKLDYNSSNCSINGRGNSTWNYWYAEKKPFNLHLSENSEILGMNASDRWALLANATDSTNLRDKMVKDFASKLDFEYSPEEQYVDLYLNGEYNGLYLISEKVEIGENRLDIPEDSVLCSFEIVYRAETLDETFSTDAEQTIEIKYPKKYSQSDLDKIKNYVQEMENAILSEDGIDEISGKSLEEIIDMDSWAEHYLVDEVFDEYDAGLASSFFYWSWDDGKIYRGPVWDFDAVGREFSNSNPETLYALREWRQAKRYYLPYYNALIRKEVFRDRVKKIYYTEFEPLLDDLVNDRIDELQSGISESSYMNLIRWKKIFNSDLYYYYNQTPESLKNFFKERKNFLDEVMIDIENYNLIYVCPYNGSDYYILTVKNGDLPDLEKLKSIEPESFVKWVDEETGEEFDTTKPITHDVKIKAETLVETSTVNEISKLITKIKWHINKLIALGTLGLLILAMGAFIFIDIRRNKLGGGYFE